MRQTATTAMVALLAISAAACTSSIKWVVSIEEALGLSSRDGKPVMLYFTFHG